MINDNNLTVSYELLYLLQWLLENEPSKLKKIINYALDQGLADQIKIAAKSSREETSEDVQYSIIDFLTLLESLLHDTLHEKRLRQIVTKKLLPALKNIDEQECNQETLELSVEKASLKFDAHPNQNPQEILFKELLKTWKPTKHSLRH